MQPRPVQSHDHSPPPLRLLGGVEQPILKIPFRVDPIGLMVVRVFPARLLDVPGGCGACPLARCTLTGKPGTDLAVCLQPAEGA